MAKHGSGSSKAKKPDNLGKGKVTPVQIAFIVDRYLADNHFTATLAAFRSEASDLFAKTKAKEVPPSVSFHPPPPLSSSSRGCFEQWGV